MASKLLKGQALVLAHDIVSLEDGPRHALEDIHRITCFKIALGRLPDGSHFIKNSLGKMDSNIPGLGRPKFCFGYLQ
jgi:hypothetical protein